MTLDLKGKRVVVTGGKAPVERAIAEAVAEGADVVIWLRKWDDNGNEAEVLPIAQLEIPTQPNGASSHTSLWRESMGRHKSYW
jgi:NAD(P)-dependent dehydrogenase (short-subunit alcohol dehydrogenase family)